MSRILSPTRWDGVRRSAFDQARPPQAVQDFGPDRRSRQDWHLLRQPAAAMSSSPRWSTRTCRRGQADRAVAKPATVSGRSACRRRSLPPGGGAADRAPFLVPVRQQRNHIDCRGWPRPPPDGRSAAGLISQLPSVGSGDNIRAPATLLTRPGLRLSRKLKLPQERLWRPVIGHSDDREPARDGRPDDAA